MSTPSRVTTCRRAGRIAHQSRLSPHHLFPGIAVAELALPWLTCEAVVSDEVRTTAGLSADALPQHEVAIRGRNEPMIVRSVTEAKVLAALVEDEQVAAA